jgi:hypothetical protein
MIAGASNAPGIALADSRALEWLIRERGFPPVFERSPPWPTLRLIDLLRSGVKYAEPLSVDAIPARCRNWGQRFLREHGPAIVAPLRSARTGRVENLHLRCLSGERRFLRDVSLRDEDGAPRGYGRAGDAIATKLLVLTEGLVDTLAAEALLADDPGCVAAGAASVVEFKTWATFLATEHLGGEVIVISHLDRENKNDLTDTGLHARGPGQRAAVVTVRALRAAGVRARVFPWWTFFALLVRAGLPEAKEHVRDLGDALRAARGRTPWASLRYCFLRALEDRS